MVQTVRMFKIPQSHERAGLEKKSISVVHSDDTAASRAGARRPVLPSSQTVRAIRYGWMMRSQTETAETLDIESASFISISETVQASGARRQPC